MSDTIYFEIPGKPFAKQRPRLGKWGAYTPKETVSFERTVGQYAMDAFNAPIEGPVHLIVRAVFEPPKSWSGKKKRDHLGKPHIQRPDLDNIEKAILDGLNRIAFADDAQVCSTECRKLWGTDAKTLVGVRAL